MLIPFSGEQLNFAVCNIFFMNLLKILQLKKKYLRLTYKHPWVPGVSLTNCMYCTYSFGPANPTYRQENISTYSIKGYPTQYTGLPNTLYRVTQYSIHGYPIQYARLPNSVYRVTKYSIQGYPIQHTWLPNTVYMVCQ